MFSTNWLEILVATPTLNEGVNFPIKTLILADHCAWRSFDNETKKIVEHFDLDKREFLNLIGRAGRALHETEGQVIILESLNNYPINPDEGYSKFLDLQDDDPALALRSTLSDPQILADLQNLVVGLESGEFLADALIFEEVSLPKELNHIASIARQLDTFSLLVDSGDIGMNTGADIFGDIFSRTFAGTQAGEAATNILVRYAHKSSDAVSNRLPAALRLLFSKTGLPIGTCTKLYEATRLLWNDLLAEPAIIEAPISRELMVRLGGLCYSSATRELAPQPIRHAYQGRGARSKSDIARPDELLADWITSGSSEQIVQTFFGMCLGDDVKWTEFTEYREKTLNYSTPWLISALWIFSREIVTALGIDLSSSILGKDLALLAACAKFGVNTPCAAIASTLGVTPNSIARCLSDEYTRAHGDGARYEFSTIFRWLSELGSEDLASFGLAPSVIRRVSEKLSLLAKRPIQMPAPDTWDVSFGIAGWRYYSGEQMLDNLHIGDAVVLRRDPENRYDPHAVELLASNGERLGFVPRDLSEQIDRRLVEERDDSNARIIRITADANPNARVIVHVSFPL